MKKLLFVAKGMPNNIKSAGDIRSLRMLQILKSKYDIHVIASSADYGIDDVRNMGCHPYLHGNVEEITRSINPDIVILSHWSIADRYIDFFRKTAAKIVIDTIDLEYLRLQRELDYKHDLTQETVNKIKAKELYTYERAHSIITASEIDDIELMKNKKFNSFILPCLYTINAEFTPKTNSNAYIICNWLHAPNKDATIYICDKIVPKTNIKFYIVGKHPPKEIVSRASEKIIICGAEYRLNTFLSNMSMCLAPTLYGAGINGKIGEALAYGIPVVTTTLGALPYKLVHKESVMIGDDEDSYVNCVNDLLTKNGLKEKLSSNGKIIMTKFTSDYYRESFLNFI